MDYPQFPLVFTNLKALRPRMIYFYLPSLLISLLGSFRTPQKLQISAMRMGHRQENHHVYLFMHSTKRSLTRPFKYSLSPTSWGRIYKCSTQLTTGSSTRKREQTPELRISDLTSTTMFKTAATKIAHNSTLPALAGNQDLRPLQDLITAEKTVLISYVHVTVRSKYGVLF